MSKKGEKEGLNYSDYYANPVAKPDKPKLKIYKIAGNEFIVTDASGNGYRIPITKANEHLRVGDYI